MRNRFLANSVRVCVLSTRSGVPPRGRIVVNERAVNSPEFP